MQKNKIRTLIMNHVKIVVDDERMPPAGWLHFLNPEDFIVWRLANRDVVIDVLSLDNDMGLEFMSGYDLVQYIEDVADMNPQSIQKLQFHSANPVAVKNMYLFARNARCHGSFPDSMNIVPERMQLINGQFSFTGLYCVY